MSEHSEAWYRGYNEYFDEKDIRDNPFTVVGKDSEDWNDGWHEAFMEVESEWLTNCGKSSKLNSNKWLPLIGAWRGFLLNMQT